MGRASAWIVDLAVAAIAVGAGFTTVYFALALTLGIEWNALASTARLESFSTHLLIPILVVVALAQATTLLGRLDSERRRIAWKLHDSAKQRIHAAHLVLSSLTPALGPPERERLRLALAELDGSAADLEASLTELRTTLGGLRLDEALRRRAGELRSASGVEIRVRSRAPSLPTFAAVHAYRVACEAITHALRHAEPGRIDVVLDVRGGALLLAVADDGRGLAGRLHRPRVDARPRRAAGRRPPHRRRPPRGHARRAGDPTAVVMPLGRLIFHITTQSAWEEARASSGRYEPRSLVVDGFIHLS